MDKIKSWEERRAQQERMEKRKALTPIVSVVMLMLVFLMFSVVSFVEASDYKVAEKEDIRVIEAVVENVDFREYQSLTDEREDTKWAAVSTSCGKCYYNFYNEDTIENEKQTLRTIVQSENKVNISIVRGKVRSGEEYQFIVDIRDGENVYFSLDDYNEYQLSHHSKYMNIGFIITAITFLSGTIGIIIICKKASIGEKNGKRNRKSD